MKIDGLVQTRNNSLSLTGLELDIMKAVWRLHPATVKAVQLAIRLRRPLAYTTVLTLMSRLHQKGFLRRSLRSRTHFYEPAVDFTDVRDAAVSNIIAQFFDGSRDRLLHFLSEGSDTHMLEAPTPNLGEGSSRALDETLL